MGNLNLSSITDNKFILEKSISTFHWRKWVWEQQNNTVEGEEVLTDDVKIAETFNSFFGNIVNTLNIEKDESIFYGTGDETDPLLHAIKNIATSLSF